MMNRQIRRAQQKQDRKVDREREKKREARKEKVERLRAQRAQRREEIKRRRAESSAAPASGDAADGQDASSGESEPKRPAAGRGRKPGRFSGALMMATVFFIVLQSAVPPEEAAGPDLLRTITQAGFYLLFGYFSTLWLMRRDTPRPVTMTLISGAMLTIGVEIAKRFQAEPTTDLLMLALAVPGLVAGAFLGRLVYTNSPG